MLTNHIYLIYIYKKDLALNNQQMLIWQKKKTTKPLPSLSLVRQKVSEKTELLIQNFKSVVQRISYILELRFSMICLSKMRRWFYTSFHCHQQITFVDHLQSFGKLNVQLMNKRYLSIYMTHWSCVWMS